MARHETTVKLKAKDETGKAFDSFKRNADEATKATARFSKGMSSAISVGARFGGAVAALGGAVVLMANNAAETVRELRGLSSASGLAINDLRAYGSATKTVGVSLGQFADITKDVNDKLGEFVATGGGGFKDFFDRVPASIRPTATELAKLSGPDVLIAVKKSMDDANVSGKEQTFILESIGNDASKLSPLLANAGEKMNKFAGSAREANKELTEGDIANIEAYGRAISSLGNSAENAKLQAAGFFGPFLESVVGQLQDIGELGADVSGGVIDSLFGFKEKNAAIAAAREFQSSLNEVKDEAENAADSVSDIVKASEDLERLEGAVKQAQAFAQAFEDAKDAQRELASNLERIQDLGEERTQRPATVLGALTTSSRARGELQKGNVEKASELALEAAEELRRVEEETGKSVTLAGTFIKNFEKIAAQALDKAKETQEALVLEIVVDGEKQQFKATKEGVKKANDFTKRQLKEAEKKRA